MKQGIKNKIIGNFIKEARYDLELTLNDLSNLIGISRGYLGEVEKGNKTIQPDKLEMILDTLNIDFNFDESVFDISNDELIKAYNHYIYEDYDDIYSIYINSSNFFYSFGYIASQLIDLLIKIVNNKLLEHYDFIIFEDLFDFMNDIQKSIYLELKANYYIKNGDIKNADITLQRLKNICCELVIPMLHLDQCIVHVHRNNQLQAIKLHEVCVNDFSNSCNESKMLWLNTISVELLLQFKKYEEADLLCDLVLSKAKRYPNKEITNKCYQLKMAILISTQKYEEVINIYNLYYKNQMNFVSTFVLYTYYKQMNFKKCSELIEKSKQITNSLNVQLFAKLLEALIQHNSFEDTKNTVTPLIALAKSKENYNLLSSLIDMYSNFLYTNHYYKEAYDLKYSSLY